MLETQHSFRRLLRLAAGLSILSSAFLFGGCAALFPGAGAPAVIVAPAERLFLTVAPFDSTVSAELTRAGLDPAAVENELKAEIRYGLFLRGQEESPDSAGAAVTARLTVKHLQPGYGRSGDYAAFLLTGSRPGDAKSSQKAEWTWEANARDNAPPALATRHLARQVAGEALSRLRAPKKDNEPPPPLHLMR
jgi:hypothetical protein